MLLQYTKRPTASSSSNAACVRWWEIQGDDVDTKCFSETVLPALLNCVQTSKVCSSGAAFNILSSTKDCPLTLRLLDTGPIFTPTATNVGTQICATGDISVN